MSQPQGPRVIFKDDRDSAISRGCVLYAASLRPEAIEMVRVAAMTAPKMRGGYVLVSEGWRDIRDGRDLHEEGRAFDVSIHNIDSDDKERAALAWSERIQSKLGHEYTVILHGRGTNRHIHEELDP